MAEVAAGSVETALRNEIEVKDSRAKELRKQLEPLEEELKTLRRMLREYSRGSTVSRDITDEDVIAFLSRSTSAENRATVQDVAKHFGRDARGFSKRLPRMSRDRLIAGSAEEGYYVPARRGRQAA